MMYDNGEGVPEDDKEAVKWFRKAAEREMQMRSRSGRCTKKAKGVLKDFKEAAKWTRKAAEQGYAGSQFSLGFFYYDGKGVPEDISTAYVWVSFAAANGNAGAKKNKGIVARPPTKSPRDKTLPRDAQKESQVAELAHRHTH